MRIGVYGGSFNPPHIGHAMVTAWLRWADLVDEVWMVPTYDHAFGKQLARFDLRMQLCEAMARMVGPWVRVCPIEAELPAPSYTIDTLTMLAARNPDDRFRLVVGADVLPETPRWKRWNAIEAQFDPIVVGRLGHGSVEGRPSFPEISSTEIRARLAAGEDVSHLVPAPVLALLPPGTFQPET